MSSLLEKELENLSSDEINMKIRMMGSKEREVFFYDYAHFITFDQLCELEDEFKARMDQQLVGNFALGIQKVERKFYVQPSEKVKDSREKPKINGEKIGGRRKETYITGPMDVGSAIGVYLSNKYGSRAKVQRLRGLIKGISKEEYLQIELKQLQEKADKKKKESAKKGK